MSFLTKSTAVRMSLSLSMALVCVSGMATERGTREEAIAMVKKAIAQIKKDGLDKTVAAVNDRNGSYIDRDLYVMIYDLKGKNLAHGGNPKMIGKDLYDIRDVDGVYFIRDRIEIAKTKGTGWQNYKFVNPVSKAVEPKSLYIERAGDVVVTSGVYN
ncbi:MAG: cache domain-containing protein [Pseudomonadota bacterium]